MIYTHARRTKVYRAVVTPAGYRAPGYTPTMIGIAAAWHFEQIEGLARKQSKKEVK